MASILNDTKKMLGIPAEHTQFDPDIIIHINSTFNILNQLGVGVDGFAIEDESAQWSDFIDDSQLNAVKSYLYMKVQLLFDPPTSGIVMQAKKDLIAEFEWRLNVQVDPKEEDDE